ncbi:MAG: type II toxin-antitoxin system RelE/ParE family toxin [Flavobacteriales bacterium]|nr:type II toxin-antitoxin system RelE/ParE family toxin [Flavobacteriales bacterium]
MRKVYLYREGEKKGSGDKFIDALVACYADIKTAPYAYQLRRGGYRHALLHKLKYRVAFDVEGNTVFVYQVRHTSRKPSKKFGP